MEDDDFEEGPIEYNDFEANFDEFKVEFEVSKATNACADSGGSLHTCHCHHLRSCANPIMTFTLSLHLH